MLFLLRKCVLYESVVDVAVVVVNLVNILWLLVLYSIRLDIRPF